MARTKLDLPTEFNFSTVIPVRITDLNYGGHVGNDTILSMIHEARMQFLHQSGYTELDFAGTGLIMSDVSIEFKQELFYGDQVRASVAIAEVSRVAFAVYYKLEKEKQGELVVAALARTGMVCYDYSAKKIATIPEAARIQFKK